MRLASCQILTPQGEGSDYGVTRYVDTKAGVVCWIYSAPYKGGIDCMPIKDTLLEKGGG